MSFLDFLFKRKSGGDGPSESMSLSEASGMIKDSAEKGISPVYPACERICGAILAEAESAKRAAAAVGEGKLDSNHMYYRIGMQMQRNFAERVPSTLSMLTKPDRNYPSFARFHALSLETIKTVAKISNDNRYLPMFLDKEIGAFGKHMNVIVKLTDELGSELEWKKDAVERLNKAHSIEEGAAGLRKEIASYSKVRAEMADRKRTLETEIASAASKNKELEKEESEIKRKIGDIRGLISMERKRLTDPLSPFQRQFRKMQKRIIEKDAVQALKSYIDGPEDAVIREVSRTGDHPMLRKILTEMKAALEKGGLEEDAKIRARRSATIMDILGGSLVAPAKRAMDLERELAAEEDAISDVSRRIGSTDAMQRSMQHDSEQMTKIEEDENSCRERIEKGISEMEALVKEETGKTVSIDRNST